MNSEMSVAFEKVIQKSENTVLYLVFGLFLFGVGIAFQYDTWLFGLGVGGLNLLLCLMVRFFFSGTFLFRATTASVMAIFMLQFVAQLHGLFEMHFWFFIFPIILIHFRDWRIYIPFGLIVTVHHVLIFGLYLDGQPEYMNYLYESSDVAVSTFLYHMGLAVLGLVASAISSYRLKIETVNNIQSNMELSARLEEMDRMTLDVKKIAADITTKQNDREENQSTSQMLASLGDDFSNAIHGLIDETNSVVNTVGVNGDLKSRMGIEGKAGNWKKMAESINQMLVSISVPVLKVTDIAQSMASGDLTQRYDVASQGDVKMLADHLNQALDNLSDLLVQISKDIASLEQRSEMMLLSGQEMEGSTHEIVGAITQMSSGAQRQLSSIENISQVLEHTLDTARGLEGRTMEVMESAKQGTENSERGKEIVQAVVSDMEKISGYSQNTKESIAVLNDRSTEISRVLGVITDISSQTNLLALNAAIEAAQAGESGRGFAVVAEEIRKLAEGSRKSAQEIEKLVSDVKRDTENATKVIDEMNISVTSGVSSSQKTAEVFNVITESYQASYNLSKQILDDSKLQVQSMSGAVTDVESVVVVAEQTAAGTEEVNSSATELSNGMANYMNISRQLNNMATELKRGIGRFKLN
ncbi:methyl-accepting chemotaxis protein [Reichenbachiella sp. MSK19-1]|uniref:methyl-accepting chemotaxis protein n=1 Tax=Reichenbachiella sp. MSK19-1 TaxID=1897631 RepID=UPI000E6BD545|nr:methyl-accepting chemotaxis protein [Reichenbachiella sp. MSK19-1]RJE74238.1 hypothetical protein BGP76_13725 [Reichenbachiella sp. MSK19-1]